MVVVYGKTGADNITGTNDNMHNGHLNPSDVYCASPKISVEGDRLMTAEEALAIMRCLAPQRLSQTQETVFRQSWEGQSYQEIANKSGYAHGYVREVGSELWQLLSETLGKKVTKKNFQSLLKQHGDSFRKKDLQPLKIVADKGITAVETSVNQFQSWGEAVNVSIFHGRTEELTTLKQWILQDGCQLVAVFGMGGIGKTTLAVKLAQQIQGEFKYLIWRSLRNAPLVLDLLAELVQFLSQQREIALPETVDGRVLRLLEYLRSCRCLLLLDNAETILNSGDRTGCYREGYESYEQLFRCVAETIHQSCLVLTSREQPGGWAAKLGEPLPVRSLQLTGLPTVTAREFLQCSGVQASEEEWKFLSEHYGGNPLALRMIAPVIRDLFDSSVSEFLELLKQGTLVFDDIRNLLEQQFNRLSDVEKQVMYWLAINREPITFPELQADLVSTADRSEILEALGSLQRRSLIERRLTGFTQQPAVMEYMIERLIKQVSQEIITESLDLLISHALVKAQAKDYIRVSQIRIILEPLVARLKSKFRSIRRIEDKLKKLLLVMQVNFSNSPGYGARNLINILDQCHADLSGCNFSELTLWQTYLQDVNLHNVNFTNADLARSVFAQTLGGIFSVAFSSDGKLLATGDTLGKLCLWRVSDGIQLWTGLGHTSLIRSVTFSPDGAKLASGSLDQTVRLWDVRTGKCSNTLQTNNQGV